MTSKIRNIVLSAGISLLTFTVQALAQKTAPSPTPVPEGNITVTSSIEIGVRGLTVNGNGEKYRSDLNYKPGLRLFNSSFNIEAKKGEFFDHALLQTSGWGGDPSGYFRGNFDKSGVYKFTSTIRRNNYYNNLLNFAPTWSQPVSFASQHRFNTIRNMGDLDMVIFPDSQKFRMRFGASYNRAGGPGMYNIRYPGFSGPATPSVRGDEFNVITTWGSNAVDLRAGFEGQLLGFNMGLSLGHREFSDRTDFFLPTFDPGNDPTPGTSAVVNFYNRKYRTRGNTDYFNYFLQRTFADKFDFAGRIIYSMAKTDVDETDLASGQSNSSPIRLLIDSDLIGVTGLVKRPQTRADLAFTWRATEKFRISDTFFFDQFNGNGSNRFFESLVSRTGAGVPRPDESSTGVNWRTNSYHKYTNLIEADFEVNRKFAFNVGYRYSHRNVTLDGITISPSTGAVTLFPETEQNHTNSGIFGARIKPTRNWGIFLDGEIGQADSVFTRTENNRYRTFRARSIARFNKWTLNFSAIVRNNTNPGYSEDILSGTTVIFPARQADATFRTRNFSTSLDWTPNDKWNFSIGHTYDHQTSNVDVIVYVAAPINASCTGVPNPCWYLGKSESYVRDNFFFFDLTAHPVNRVTFFASYRIDRDTGQGSRVITRPQDLIYSYPMRFQSPEGKVSIKINRHLDWDIGYKYYSYWENVPYSPFPRAVLGSNIYPQVYPQQNYTAHMPYTALRIYFGRSSDRR